MGKEGGIYEEGPCGSQRKEKDRPILDERGRFNRMGTGTVRLLPLSRPFLSLASLSYLRPSIVEVIRDVKGRMMLTRSILMVQRSLPAPI